MSAGTTMGCGWHFWIDRGGTFTDIVARGSDGGHRRVDVGDVFVLETPSGGGYGAPSPTPGADQGVFTLSHGNDDECEEL